MNKGFIRKVLDSLDMEFYQSLLKLAVPIVLQRLLNAMLFLLDNVMVGNLGAETITAVGIAGNVSFLMLVFTFGISSSASIFLGQYWGKKDLVSLKKIEGIMLLFSAIIGIVFSGVAIFMSAKVIGIWSNDAEVIAIGARYLRVVGFGYLLQAISAAYVVGLRSCGITMFAMKVSFVASIVNSVIDLILINGYLGFPALGAVGSAIGTLIGLAIEFVCIISYVYIKKTPLAARLDELKFDKKLLSRFMETGWPVMINEIFWSLGVTACVYSYSKLGTNTQAASFMFDVIERFFYIFVAAFGAAGATFVGNAIGARRKDLAEQYAKNLLKICIVLGVTIPFIMLASAPGLAFLFNVGDDVKIMTYQMVKVYAFSYIVDCLNMVLIISIMRAGGDTKVATLLELAPMWLISVLLSNIAAHYFNAPLWVCYSLIQVGNVVKCIFGLIRWKSGRWINDLTSGHEMAMQN